MYLIRQMLGAWHGTCNIGGLSWNWKKNGFRNAVVYVVGYSYIGRYTPYSNHNLIAEECREYKGVYGVLPVKNRSCALVMLE